MLTETNTNASRSTSNLRAFAQQNKFEEILVKGSKDFLFLASTQTFKMLRKGI